MSLCILCPGQASQSSKMLNLLPKNSLTQDILNYTKLLLKRDLSELVNSKDMFLNIYAQPLIVSTQMAMWQSLSKLIPKPRLIAGYSIGELSAYGCAGAIKTHELIYLSKLRAQRMSKANKRKVKMLIVSDLSHFHIDMLCKEYNAQLAIIINTKRFLVAVCEPIFDTFVKRIDELGGGYTLINVEVAAHTKWLSEASCLFSKDLESSKIKDPQIPVLSATSVGLVYKKEMLITDLSKQISHYIDWQTVSSVLLESCKVVLEIGSSNWLTNMLRQENPYISARAVVDFKNIEASALWVHSKL